MKLLPMAGSIVLVFKMCFSTIVKSDFHFTTFAGRKVQENECIFFEL